jgi:predicted RNA-binding Zn-ribbon protein involved in translation (DUF1610 family)
MIVVPCPVCGRTVEVYASDVRLVGDPVCQHKVTFLCPTCGPVAIPVPLRPIDQWRPMARGATGARTINRQARP